MKCNPKISGSLYSRKKETLDSQRGLTSKPVVLNILTWNRPHKQEATPLKSSGERRCVKPL